MTFMLIRFMHCLYHLASNDVEATLQLSEGQEWTPCLAGVVEGGTTAPLN